MQASAANPCLENRHRRCRFHNTRCYPAGANTQAETKCKHIKQASTQHPFSNMQTPPNAVAARMQLSQPQLWRCLEPNQPRDAFCNSSLSLRMKFSGKDDHRIRFCKPSHPHNVFFRMSLHPQSALGCDFAAWKTSRCDFATPVRHRMRFCSPRTSGCDFATPIGLGMRFCTPVDFGMQFSSPRMRFCSFATPPSLCYMSKSRKISHVAEILKKRALILSKNASKILKRSI